MRLRRLQSVYSRTRPAASFALVDVVPRVPNDVDRSVLLKVYVHAEKIIEMTCSTTAHRQHPISMSGCANIEASPFHSLMRHRPRTMLMWYFMALSSYLVGWTVQVAPE